MPNTLDQINVTTRRYIDENPKLRDLVFNYDPIFAMIGEDCHDEVEGGSSWNDNILYDVQDGGPYSKGQDLPADQRQLEQQLRFDPKYNAIMIPFYKEDIKVLNVGALAVVKLIEERVDAAFEQLGAQAALQFYLQGQLGNYTKFPNGLTEALNDGVTVGWDGNTYPNYGTLTRTASQFTGTRLVPTAPTQVTGSITLAQMETAYQATNFGSGKYEINVIATTAKGFGYVRQNYQTQQRFQNVTVAKIGFRGLEYNGAVIMASRYAPGSYLTANSGTNDRVATRMFSYATGGAVTSYPAGSLGTGETMWFLNVRKPFIKYRTSKSRPYNGSLDDDGFIPSAGNTRLVGKVLLAQNFTVLPGYHTYLWGFTG